MKRIIFILILVTSTHAFSQEEDDEDLQVLPANEINIQNSPYKNAPENIKKTMAYQREKIFYEQRMYPNNFIPENAFGNALNQKAEMLNSSRPIELTQPWTSLGPTGLNHGNTKWTGRVATIKYDPVNPNIIYLGSADGGVWKSTDGGSNWAPISDFEVSICTGALAIDPTNTNIIYCGTGDYAATWSYLPGGLLKSTNGGVSWINYTSGLPARTPFCRLVIRPAFPNQLFAAMKDSGLYKSMDAGANWVRVLPGRCDDVVFSPDGNNVYVIGKGTDFQTSTDGGATFVNHAGYFRMGVRNQLAICYSSPSVLYLLMWEPGLKIYKTTDNCETFRPVTPISGRMSQGWYDLYIHVSPFDPNLAFVGLFDVWRTTDGGISFNKSNGDPEEIHPDQQNMDFNPLNQNEIICANDGGIYKSTDKGITWTNLNATLSLSQFFKISSDPSNPNRKFGGLQDNGVPKTEGSIQWDIETNLDGKDVVFNTQNPLLVVYSLVLNMFMRYSTDAGMSFTGSVNTFPGNASLLAPLISDPVKPGTFYAAKEKIFKNTFPGESDWTMLPSTGLTGHIRTLAVSRNHTNIFYAGNEAGLIYKSIDSGTTFSNISSGLPQRYLTGLQIHPDSDNVVLVSFSGFGAGKIYKTTNGGTNWVNITSNLPDSPANDVLIYNPGSATGTYAAATDAGVFITTNYGSNWTVLGTGLPNSQVTCFDHNLVNGKIRVGTFGRGVWETSLSLAHASEQSEKLKLFQNFPNPFNPSTVIKYQLGNTEFVKLEIYDLSGRLVAELVNRIQVPGTYSVMYDMENLASGIYFYKLRVGDNIESKKMILIK